MYSGTNQQQATKDTSELVKKKTTNLDARVSGNVRPGGMAGLRVISDSIPTHPNSVTEVCPISWYSAFTPDSK
jgi:hypothetical protein